MEKHLLSSDLHECCCPVSHLACPLRALVVVLQEAAAILGQSLHHLQPGQVLLVMQDAHAPLLQRRGHREHVLKATVPGHRRLAVPTTVAVPLKDKLTTPVDQTAGGWAAVRSHYSQKV